MLYLPNPKLLNINSCSINATNIVIAVKILPLLSEYLVKYIPYDNKEKQAANILITIIFNILNNKGLCILIKSNTYSEPEL